MNIMTDREAYLWDLYKEFPPPYGPAHQMQVLKNSKRLAKSYFPRRQAMLVWVAMLHDIGMVDGLNGHTTVGVDIAKEMFKKDMFNEIPLKGYILLAIAEHHLPMAEQTCWFSKIIHDAEYVADPLLAFCKEFYKYAGQSARRYTDNMYRYIANKAADYYNTDKVWFPETVELCRAMYRRIKELTPRQLRWAASYHRAVLAAV